MTYGNSGLPDITGIWTADADLTNSCKALSVKTWSRALWRGIGRLSLSATVWAA